MGMLSNLNITQMKDIINRFELKDSRVERELENCTQVKALLLKRTFTQVEVKLLV